jgi:putative transposase
MAELSREYGISRKTGHQIFDRYQECGIQGLTDRSCRPYRYANQLPFQVENFILNVKHEHPSWGARKIRERLIQRFSSIPIPAKSTIHALLDRHVEPKINFFRPVWEARLRAEGKVVRRGTTIGYIECEITDEGERLVAKASSTGMALRGERAKGR